jgi:hypothetical protein
MELLEREYLIEELTVDCIQIACHAMLIRIDLLHVAGTEQHLMVFHKKAFARRDHKAITKYIMGDRFDPAMFEDVHRYIDGSGGNDHRVKHGHNKEAEREIHKKWGEVGVEIFKIHILSDPS